MASGYWRISPEILKKDSNYSGRYRILDPVPLVRPDEWTVYARSQKTILLDVGIYSGVDNNNDPISISVNVPVFIPIGESSNNGLKGDFSAYVGTNKPISVSSTFTTNQIAIEPYQDVDNTYYAQLYFYCFN